MTSDAGKGDKRRPFDQQAWDTGWDRLFNKQELSQEVIQQYKEQQLIWKIQGTDREGGETE